MLSFNGTIFTLDVSLNSDDSLNIMKTIAEHDNRLTIVSLYRNYGKSASLSEGFKLAKGNYVITIDGNSNTIYH